MEEKLMPLQEVKSPWDEMWLDLVSGLKKSNGFIGIVVMVDRFSKYAIYTPYKKTPGSKSLIRILKEKVIEKYGMPKRIISDRGAQFTSKEWKGLEKSFNTKVCSSSAYHPQSDSQSERQIKTLIEYLRAFSNRKLNNWSE
jgi:transposase InsO family protein